MGRGSRFGKLLGHNILSMRTYVKHFNIQHNDCEEVPNMEQPKEYTLTWEVTDDMTAKRIGSAGASILSTPNMLALMEAAALELAKSYLDEGMTTVGAEAHVRHLAPTPVGMKVSATATLRSIERRKMWFDIKVCDERGKCGEGSHLRIMVPDQDRSKNA